LRHAAYGVATLLYQLVAGHYPTFAALREKAGRPLPAYVREEFEAYLSPPRPFAVRMAPAPTGGGGGML